MNVEDVYIMFDKNWAKVARELKLGRNTAAYWRKIGYIPMPMQIKIQHATFNNLLADINK